MPSARRLADVDRRIREATLHIALYRNPIARRHKNPALAEQADRLLPLMLTYLNQLVGFRRNLASAIKLQKSFPSNGEAIPLATEPMPRLPRILR